MSTKSSETTSSGLGPSRTFLSPVPSQVESRIRSQARARAVHSSTPTTETSITMNMNAIVQSRAYPPEESWHKHDVSLLQHLSFNFQNNPERVYLLHLLSFKVLAVRSESLQTPPSSTLAMRSDHVCHLSKHLYILRPTFSSGSLSSLSLLFNSLFSLNYPLSSD